MRKSTVILTSGLWLLALSNLWLLVRLGDEHARNAELRAQVSARGASATAPGWARVIVNAPSDIPTANPGPSARGIVKPTSAARPQ